MEKNKPFTDRGRKDGKTEEGSEFSHRLIEVKRVTRVVAGGKRLRFRACVIVGNSAGQIGYGLGKGNDVTLAVNKAVNQAKKRLITVPLWRGTIPHPVRAKFSAAKILLKPAPVGTGILAGGTVRQILDLAGIKDVVSKVLGSKNKINNIKATLIALQNLKPRKEK